MKLIRSAIPFLVVISITTSCYKSPPPVYDNPYGLPNATQVGADIFACRVDRLVLI